MPQSKFSALKKLFEGKLPDFSSIAVDLGLPSTTFLMSLSVGRDAFHSHLTAYLEYFHPNDFLLNFSAVLAKTSSSSRKHFCGMWGE